MKKEEKTLKERYIEMIRNCPVIKDFKEHFNIDDQKNKNHEMENGKR